jgi:hypothetical protein
VFVLQHRDDDQHHAFIVLIMILYATPVLTPIIILSG